MPTEAQETATGLYDATNRDVGTTLPPWVKDALAGAGKPRDELRLLAGRLTGVEPPAATAEATEAAVRIEGPPESTAVSPERELREKAVSAMEREAQVAERNAAQMGQEIERLRTGMPPTPEPPKRPVLPERPSAALRPFMEPGEKAKVGQTLGQFVTLLGTAATLFGGRSKDAAGGALSALTGALAGWSEGDRERVERELLAWREHTNHLLVEHSLELEEYRAVLENKRISWDQQALALQLVAHQHENMLAAARARTQGAMGALQLYEDQDRWSKEYAVKVQAANAAMIRALNPPATLGGEEAKLRDALMRDEARKRKLPVTQDTPELRRQDELTIAAGRASKAMGPAAAEEVKGVEPLPGEWLDTKEMRLAQPTREQAAKEPGRYRRVQQQEARLIEFRPYVHTQLDRLGELTDRLFAAHAPAQIVEGLRGHVAKALGDDPDWAEFFTILTDTNIEQAAALSPGQMRIGVLRAIQTEAAIRPQMTKAAAHRVLGTIRTNFDNRVAGIASGGTSAGQTPYNKPAVPAGATKIRVRNRATGELADAWLYPGEALPEGYERVK